MTDLHPPTSVLFICMGNICRSPLAEGVFRHKVKQEGAGDRFFIDSAGTGGWHVGAPPDERMRSVAEAHGVVLDSAARQVEPDDFERFQHLLCADEDNREDLLAMGAPADRVRLLLECDPSAPMVEIPDPYYGGEDGFRLVYRLVDSACDALLRELLVEPS
jgi:protein-tyrosine phosphatase